MPDRRTRGGSARTARLGAALTLLLAVVASALAAPASAQDTPAAPSEGGFAVQPSGPDGPGTRDWFVYTLDPGAVWGDTVAISNVSDRPIRFLVYPTDAVSIPGTGGFALLRDDETPVDVGTWIQLAAGEYTVEPGQRVDIPFTITVPDDAEPGDHAGAILATDADAAAIDPNAAPEGLSFDVRQRIGARVYVRVNGEVAPALRIDSLEVDRRDGAANVTWEITNTGNLRLAPTAELRISGLFGRTVATLPAQQLAEMLPGSNLLGAAVVDELPSLEPLTAHLVVRAEGVEVERSRRFGAFPWPLLVSGVILLGALGWYLRRRHRRRHPRLATPRAEPPSKVPVSA